MNTLASFGDNVGRLGNQLFQLALLVAIRARRGHDFYLDTRGAAVSECFELDLAAVGPPCLHTFIEGAGRSTVFRPEVFDQPAGTAFDGYFQSFRYLEGCEDLVPRFFRFQLRHRAYSEALLFAYRRRSGRPLVGVHVRRTDYVAEGSAGMWGDLWSDGYYERALAAVDPDATFLVFSDDIAWCREVFAPRCVAWGVDPERIELADFDGPTSLALLTGCDVLVIANSSFSWWGAYLNPAADVYAPSRWFGPDMLPPNDRPDDIVVPAWRQIPVSWGTQDGPAGRPARASAS